MRFIIVVLIAFCIGACSQSRFTHADDLAIRDVLARQQDGWNSGSIDAYMEGYAQNDSIRFISGGNISYGWNTVSERYKHGYTDKTAMGTLAFSDIAVQGLSPTQAIVYGKWELTREDDHPWGRFTLLFEKQHGVWRIVHDHTSVAK